MTPGAYVPPFSPPVAAPLQVVGVTDYRQGSPELNRELEMVKANCDSSRTGSPAFETSCLDRTEVDTKYYLMFTKRTQNIVFFFLEYGKKVFQSLKNSTWKS
ncbi:hypothetical protein AVEN_208007-1 [Araneus ventricosus]|uniref:Uncharacterized protein n=1 Tax=Araneus ventricosus TaxID=182803 RepID=A0A4Y2W779_ARAVE|nr:hypothetical protein AVEN_208007-1 [Araneus ventricosus]